MEKITKTITTSYARILHYDLMDDCTTEFSEHFNKHYDSPDDFFKEYKKSYKSARFVPLKVLKFAETNSKRVMSLDCFLANAHVLLENENRSNLITRTVKATKITVLCWYDGCDEIFKEESYVVKKQFTNAVDACKYVQKRHEYDGKKILKATALEEVSQTLAMNLDVFVNLSDIEQ